MPRFLSSLPPTSSSSTSICLLHSTADLILDMNFKSPTLLVSMALFNWENQQNCVRTLLRPPVPDQPRNLEAPCPQCHLSSQTAYLASAQPGQVNLNIFKHQISPPPPQVLDRTPPSGRGPAQHRPRNLWLQHRRLSSQAPLKSSI